MSGRMKKKSSVMETGSWTHRGETQSQHSTSSSKTNPIAGLSPRRGVASAKHSKRQDMKSVVVPILTRGLCVEFTQGKHVIEATVLKTVTGIGYSVLTDNGQRRLIPSDQVFITRR